MQTALSVGGSKEKGDEFILMVKAGPCLPFFCTCTWGYNSSRCWGAGVQAEMWALDRRQACYIHLHLAVAYRQLVLEPLVCDHGSNLAGCHLAIVTVGVKFRVPLLGVAVIQRRVPSCTKAY